MNNKNNEQDLTKPASVNLAGSASPAEMAQREGWDPTRYALVLAENVRRTDVPLKAQNAAMRVLSALKVLRDAPPLSPQAPTTPMPVLVPSVTTAEADYPK